MNSDEDDDVILPENLPIYRKGKEILDITDKIAALIPENDDYLMNVKAFILSNAAQLTVKVAGAEAAGLYDLKMENAAIIRKAARDLIVQQHSLDMFGFEYPEYYQIVRNLIEEYRLLFIDWVAGFDKWDYVIDRWGLFILRALVHSTKTPTKISLFMVLKKIQKNEKLSVIHVQYFNISGHLIKK